MIWREDSRRLHWGVVLFGLLLLPSSLLFLFFFTHRSGASAPTLAEITAGKATPSPAAAPLAAPPPAPTSASPPIYLQAIGDTTRVSVDSFGSQSNGNSYDASMSADSNAVAFDSFANNLVVLDTNGRGDVFIHDRLTGTTTRLSLNSSGVQGNGDSAYPSVSGDGSMVSFRSAATNLIPSDTNGVIDIFLRNRTLSATSLISSASDATLGNGASLFSAISADGAVVTFHSSATNLVLNDTNGVWDIFTKDVGTGITRRVSVSSGGVQGNGDSLFPAISQDGRYVTFHSMATNLVPGDTFAFADVFRHDRATGTTVRVSLTYTGDQANGSSYNPSISFDGRYIAFESAATNLVAADTNNATDIFLRDVLLGTTRRISVASDLTQANSWSGDASISSDAHYISYHSNATNLVPGDTNNALDVFVYNTQTGHTERSSVSTSGIEGNASSTYSSIGGDGRFVAFSSSATNLVVGDTNAADDVFVHELTGNTATPSLTPTSTSTITPSPTLSLTPTNTATYTSTPSNTPSETPSPTSTFSPTPSETPTETSSPTNTPTPSDTVPPSDTPTPTATWTPSLTPTITLTPTQSDTPSPTLSPTSSATWTPTNTPTVSPTPTQTFTPSNTPTPSETPTITPSPTPTFTQTPTNTFTPTLTPTNTNTPTSTYTPTETFTPTNTWTPSMTPTPTLTPTITPSVTVIPPPVYTIQGRVTDEAGNPLAGVIILVNEAETTLTDENGYYALSNLVEGTYTIAASSSGYVFTTSVEMPLILPPSHLNVDFVGKTTVTYTITGQVKDVLGKPMAGVTVEFGPDLVTTLDLEEGRRVITDTAGIFVIRGLNAGRYVLSPTANGFNFTPARREVGVPPSASGQVFIGIKASPATYTISGRIVEPSGKPLPGVIINLGARLSVISDANGNFNMRGVPPGTYVLSAQKSGFLFTPAMRTINVPHDLSNQNFSAVRKR